VAQVCLSGDEDMVGALAGVGLAPPAAALVAYAEQPIPESRACVTSDEE
jgi:hypothetical protein